jgi:hypothetical protein
MAKAKATNTSPRVDPVLRQIDFFSQGIELINPDPSKAYVLAYKGDSICGRSYYQALGYEIELHSETGVRLRAGSTGQTGEEMEWMGHVLMSCSKERKAQMDAAGKAWANRIEERIVDRKKGMQDLLRGIPGRGQFMRVVNDSTSLRPETGFEEDNG